MSRPVAPWIAKDGRAGRDADKDGKFNEKGNQKFSFGTRVRLSQVDVSYAPNATKDHANPGEVAEVWVDYDPKGPPSTDSRKGKFRPVLIVGHLKDDPTKVVGMQFTTQPGQRVTMQLTTPGGHLRNESVRTFADYTQLIVIDPTTKKRRIEVWSPERFKKYLGRLNQVNKDDTMTRPTAPWDTEEVGKAMTRPGFMWVPSFINDKGRRVRSHWRRDPRGHKKPNVPDRKPVAGKKPAPKPKMVQTHTGGPRRPVKPLDPAKKRPVIKPQAKKPVDAREAQLKRMGAKTGNGRGGLKALVEGGMKNEPKRPKSPITDGKGNIKNSKGQWEDIGNNAERKALEQEMAHDQMVYDQKKAGKKPKGGLDFKDKNLDGLGLDEQPAAQAWYTAMVAANAGDKEGFLAALATYFDNDPQRADDLRDAVDDYIDAKHGDDWYDKGLANIKKWKVKIEVERAKFIEGKRKNIALRTDMSGNPAYVFLMKGGSLRDAPSDGLADAIEAMPQRFGREINKSKGVSPNWWIIDKSVNTGTEVSIPVMGRSQPIRTSNEVWVLKASAGSDFFDIPEDVLNENLGHELQSQLGIDAPQLRFATRADAQVPMVMQEHFEQFYEGDRTVTPAKKFAGPAAEQWLVEHMPNPEEAVDLALFDFLIGNQDRHHGNWFVMAEFDKTDDSNDRYHIGVFDNGYGFYGTWKKGFREKDPRDVFKHGYPKKFMAMGLKAMGKDRKRFAAAVDDFISRARTVEVAKFEARLKDVGLSASQKTIVKDQLAILQERIANLEKYKQDIIDMVR